jgi:hypothetical protein
VRSLSLIQRENEMLGLSVALSFAPHWIVARFCPKISNSVTKGLDLRILASGKMLV